MAIRATQVSVSTLLTVLHRMQENNIDFIDVGVIPESNMVLIRPHEEFNPNREIQLYKKDEPLLKPPPAEEKFTLDNLRDLI